MHPRLANALTYLDIGHIDIYDDTLGVKKTTINPKAHATALFTYLDLAGYLSPEILEKAARYLSAARPFSCDVEVVIAHLKTACVHRDEEFNVEKFFDIFCNTPYFEVEDIIDLIVFLQQTAFDRAFGQERDRLAETPFLEKHKELFKKLALEMGIVTALPPTQPSYCGTGIMGAASYRVQKRIEYFKSLTVDYGQAWALSGSRELSKGLDSEEVMIKVAEAVEKPVIFIEKGTGAAARVFLNGVTETMMVNYLLQEMCPGQNIHLVDSAIEEGHWRATTAQGAQDIAHVLVQKIKTGELLPNMENTYCFMIIAEQPYAGRMARQVQRAFNIELKAQGLNSSVTFVVEGVGSAISEEGLTDVGVLTRMNSELGAIMAERYNDACIQLKANKPGVTLRDPAILMFAKRDETFVGLQNLAQEQSGLTI